MPGRRCALGYSATRARGGLTGRVTTDPSPPTALGPSTSVARQLLPFMVCAVSKVKVAVDLATVADGRDGHDVGLVVNGVDDAVVPGSNAHVRTVTDE